MSPRNTPRRRAEPDLLPDSLPNRGDAPDLLPDDLRRNDQPDLTPDSLPPERRSASVSTDTRPDGGIAQHPIHDEDQEDLAPEDYEEEIEEVQQVGIERRRRAGEEIGAGDEFTTEELGSRSIPRKSD
jgi:hypothetical protein